MDCHPTVWVQMMDCVSFFVNIVEVTLYQFPDPGLKRLASAMSSFEILALGTQLPCSEEAQATLWRGTCGEKQHPTPT